MPNGGDDAEGNKPPPTQADPFASMCEGIDASHVIAVSLVTESKQPSEVTLHPNRKKIAGSKKSRTRDALKT